MSTTAAEPRLSEIPLLRALNTEWRYLAALASTGAALTAWSEREPGLAGCTGLEDLVAASRNADPRAREELLRALIRAAQSGVHTELATRCVLQLMLPSVVVTARRIAFRFEDVGEAASALCGALYAIVPRTPATRRKLAAGLHLDLLKHALASAAPRPGDRAEHHVEQDWLGFAEDGIDAEVCERADLDRVLHEALAARIVDPTDPVLTERAAAPHAPANAREQLLLLLSLAVERGALRQEEARLTARSVSSTAPSDQQLAREAGCTVAALRQRRSRAIARLKLFLASGHRGVLAAA